jgi:hypothetical protein
MHVWLTRKMSLQMRVHFYQETGGEKCIKIVNKGPSTLTFLASVSPSAMAPPPNYFLCAITYVIAREKQRKQLGSGAITDGETDAKTRV